MWGICRLFLLASVCMVLFLAGCVPIQPESPVAGDRVPVSSAQDSSKATPEPIATATPEPTAPAAPVVSTDWQEYVDPAHGLSISYPPGWIFVDPTKKELMDLLAEADELTNSDEIRELLATFADAMQQGELFVGVGFQYVADSFRDLPYLNNFNAIVVLSEGLSLHLMAQMVAAQLDSVTGIAVESAEVVAGLRPDGAEALSIRYRADGALYNRPDLETVGWQVGVLSPDAETMLILTYSIVSEDFAALEPLLGEIVQRVQWFE